MRVDNNIDKNDRNKMRELTEKRYLDEEGLKKIFNYFNNRIPDNMLLGTVNTITISADNNNFSAGEMENNTQRRVIFVHSGVADSYTVSIPATYKTPDGQPMSVSVPKNGFAIVDFIKIDNVIYAHGV